MHFMHITATYYDRLNNCNTSELNIIQSGSLSSMVFIHMFGSNYNPARMLCKLMRVTIVVIIILRIFYAN